VKCPVCNKPADVLETRRTTAGVRRRYECFNHHRFSTLERIHEFKKGTPCVSQQSKSTSSSA
jgi:transcriptional regulator NrdR family protein